MAGSSFALVVASDRFEDPALRQLRGPAQEAQSLAETLADPLIGGFQVRTLINKAAHVVTEEIETFFTDRARDDLLLLYVSCHGIKDDNGRLYFATTSTKLSRLAATGVSSVFVNEQMDQSRSRKIVLFLDCCYSGAFARGMVPRSAGTIDIQERFDGRGRAIITASTAMEYAFETDGQVVSGSGVPSLFTRAVLDGLRTGDADLDGDGRVSVDELYDYVFRIVREATPDQTPSMMGNFQGDLYIARSPLGRTKPAADPARPPGPPSGSPAAAVITGEPAPAGGRTRRKVRPSPPVLAVLGLLLVILVTLVVVQVTRAPSGTDGESTPPPSQTGSQPSSSPSSTDPATNGVLSEGRVRLTDPTTGLDLEAGQVVAVFQSHLAWNGLTRSLSVFDDTTLGAVVLEDAHFQEVTPAQLAAQTYKTGEANPPLTRADLPPGDVLAVHVTGQDYAKITVVRYGPGDDLNLRWVTYRNLT